MKSGWVRKTWGVIAQVLVITTVVTFIGGAVAFYDAPLRVEKGAYLGKWGNVHSETAYRLFNIWEPLLLGLFVATIVIFAARAVYDQEWLRNWQMQRTRGWKDFFR